MVPRERCLFNPPNVMENLLDSLGRGLVVEGLRGRAEPSTISREPMPKNERWGRLGSVAVLIVSPTSPRSSVGSVESSPGAKSRRQDDLRRRTMQGGAFRRGA
eukprot:5442383-Pyramimonas_sp.AAC.1